MLLVSENQKKRQGLCLIGTCPAFSHEIIVLAIRSISQSGCQGLSSFQTASAILTFSTVFTEPHFYDLTASTINTTSLIQTTSPVDAASTIIERSFFRNVVCV
jgi:hypothetical protein